MRRLMAQPGGGGARAGAAAARAFSLAELMIALGILGIGLLIIAAALPVGMQKTRDTAEQALGDAATSYALDVVAARLRLPKDAELRPFLAPMRDSIVRPRFSPGQTGEGTLAKEQGSSGRDWEPWIKVRPLVTQNLAHTASGSESAGTPIESVGELIEGQVVAAIRRTSFPIAWATDAREVFVPGMLYPVQNGWLPPALSVLETVYPAVAPDPVRVGSRDMRFTPAVYFESAQTPYQRHELRTRATTPAALRGSEAEKALVRRVSWVTFYRRMANKHDATGTSSSNVYEFVAVAVARPSERHRFARPVPPAGSWAPYDPQAPRFDSRTSLVPVPFLVTFKEFDWLRGGAALSSSVDYLTDTTDPRRSLNPTFSRPTLRFQCSDRVGMLLTKGSILIPATNDDALSGLTGTVVQRRRSGFVPHAPDTLPIYTVSEVIAGSGNDDWTVVVEGNGFYPWVSDSVPANQRGRYWPVWVIPPSFTEFSGTGNNATPVFERRSPIISVARRVIALPEVP